MSSERQIEDRIEFFRQNGYVVVPNALAAADVVALNQAVRTDIEQYPGMWAKGSDGRVQNANVLLSCPALDDTIWHPAVLPLIEALLGPDLCFEELSVMLRGPWTAEAPAPEWHRDTGHLPERPFALKALSVIYY